jgi:hypothetical protein
MQTTSPLLSEYTSSSNTAIQVFVATQTDVSTLTDATTSSPVPDIHMLSNILSDFDNLWTTKERTEQHCGNCTCIKSS